MYLLLQATQTVPKSKIMADEVSRLDPWGIGMMIIGMVIVFTSLLLLFILFSNISRAIKKKMQVKKEVTIDATAAQLQTNGVNTEVTAAIATALHLYLAEQHDNEQAILTIQRVSRSYSPWSSKLYGLRNHPRA